MQYPIRDENRDYFLFKKRSRVMMAVVFIFAGVVILYVTYESLTGKQLIKEGYAPFVVMACVTLFALWGRAYIWQKDDIFFGDKKEGQNYNRLRFHYFQARSWLDSLERIYKHKSQGRLEKILIGLIYLITFKRILTEEELRANIAHAITKMQTIDPNSPYIAEIQERYFSV